MTFLIILFAAIASLIYALMKVISSDDKDYLVYWLGISILAVFVYGMGIMIFPIGGEYIAGFAICSLYAKFVWEMF